MADSETDASIEFVANLEANCAFDDGYRCSERVIDDFLFSQDKMVSGPYFEAWAVAYEDFSERADLNDEQKKLKHYKIGLTENETNFVVVFRALLLPAIEGGEVKGVLRTTLGRSMRYLVDKTTMQVRQVQLYR